MTTRRTLPVGDSESQLRYLLRYAVAASLLIGGYFVWSEVTPAFGVLDQIEISSKSVEVKQTITELDGTSKVLTSHEEVKTTAKHAVLACLIVGFGLLIARTFPALIDVLVLERMPIDKGQRYAAAMILRLLAHTGNTHLGMHNDWPELEQHSVAGRGNDGWAWFRIARDLCESRIGTHHLV